MKEQPLRTTVIGSYPFPAWLELASQQLDQLAMARGAIGQGARGFDLAITLQGDDQFLGADIQAGQDNGGLFHWWI